LRLVNRDCSRFLVAVKKKEILTISLIVDRIATMNKEIFVSRSELATMLGIANKTAVKYLNPATPIEKLPKEWRELFTEPWGEEIAYTKTGKTNAGKPVYAYPIRHYFPLCRWPDVKKLAETRPDVVGEYVAWVMKDYGVKLEGFGDDWTMVNLGGEK